MSNEICIISAITEKYGWDCGSSLESMAPFLIFPPDKYLRTSSTVQPIFLASNISPTHCGSYTNEPCGVPGDVCDLTSIFLTLFMSAPPNLTLLCVRALLYVCVRYVYSPVQTDKKLSLFVE